MRKVEGTDAPRCKSLAIRKPLEQGPGMRGSPVLRFILLAIALVATAVGFQRVTSARVEAGLIKEVEKPAAAWMEVPFHLILSAPAAAVELDTGKRIRRELEALPVSGTLEMDAANPQLALVVRWKNPAAAGEHRFAKLTLEPPGQATITHVFDADGDIDDILELPLPAGK